jgi:uncharacterized protein
MEPSSSAGEQDRFSTEARAIRRQGLVLDGTRKLMPGFAVRVSPIDGLGCFATLPFNKDEVIAEYTGERIDHREAMRRMKGPGRMRITQFDTDSYIDGSLGGNDTQYINHSCEPNADAIVVNGLLLIFTLREISPGEEITIDYLNSFEDDLTECLCRTDSCKERLKQEAA